MAKSIIDKILDNIFDAEFIGRRGEKLTERELKLVQLLGRKGKVLRNVYIPKDNGDTSEIDVLFITQKGIFVIESKNYSGWVFGKEKDAYWTVTLPNKSRNKLYNPIMQNRTHIKWLANYLQEEIPLFSLIVFSERCELKNVTVESKDIPVIKRDRLYASIRDIWNVTEDKISEEQINNIYTKLELLTHVDKDTKQAHVDSIKSRYNMKKKQEVVKEAVETTVEEAIETTEETVVVNMQRENDEVLICPRCGATLILRVAKKGQNAGNSFYGCSNFPKCRYIRV